MFIVGNLYNRKKDIHYKYGGNQYSGIAPCAGHPYVFLFSSPQGEEYGYQDDWLTDQKYQYTGEGQFGKMEMERGNKVQIF